MAVDDVDLEILRVLGERGRITLTDLAAEVHLSRTSVHGRLGQLHRDGVVRGYAARIDPAKVGLPITALILIGIDQERLPQLRAALAELPEIERWALTMGEFDGFIIARVRDVDTLRDLIVNRLRELPGVTRTQSVLVIEESPERAVLPHAVDG